MRARRGASNGLGAALVLSAVVLLWTSCGSVHSGSSGASQSPETDTSDGPARHARVDTSTNDARTTAHDAEANASGRVDGKTTAPESPEHPPEHDDDHDGLLAPADDACPGEAEDYDGVDDTDGCPDGSADTAEVRIDRGASRILVRPKFTWTDADRLADGTAPQLDALAFALRAHPDLHVEVQSHIAPREEYYGMRPTDRRANELRDGIIQRGVAARRVRAVGYGETRPIDTNETPEGRENNDRIEIVIVDPPISP